MSLMEIRQYCEELRDIKNVLGIDKFDSDELEELCDNLSTEDFTIELIDNEYRFIQEGAIDSIYQDAIRELVEDCYLVGEKETPWWIAIDWEQTAQNCLMDGYGHTFSGYDGSEENVAGYYIFRTN